MTTSKNSLFNYLLFPSSKRLLTGIVLMLFVSGLIGYLFPQLISSLMSQYGKSGFTWTLTVISFLLVLQYINLAIYQVLINRYVQDLTLSIRTECYQKWMAVYDIQRETEVKKEFPLGEIVARIMGDTDALRELVSSGSFTIIIDTLFICSCLISFLQIHWQLGGMLLTIEIISLLILLYSGRKMMLVFSSARHVHGLVSRTVADVTGGMASTYYTPHYNYGSHKSQTIFDHFLKIQLKANFYDAAYYSFAESLFPVFLLLIVIFIPFTEVKALATVAVMIDLIQRSIGPIKSLAGKISGIQRALVGFQRVDEFLKHLKEFKGPDADGLGLDTATSSLAPISGFLRLEVSIPFFQYSYRMQEKEKEDFRREFCLKNIHFVGSKGTLIGVVGLSGSGKSTLLNILAANIIPKQVTINIHTKDMQQITLSGDQAQDVAFYKEQVSLVSQDSHIFSGTLCFNITLDKNATPTTIAFWDFWQYMCFQIPYLDRWGITPHDWITPRSLSQGQKQLVQAMRALYHQRPIVLLDEISSALDSDLEEALRRLIMILQQNSLTILVTHRIETIRLADQIFVMKDGEIEASGKHGELMQTSDTYKEFIATGLLQRE